jgi:ankyrin repeat protein
MQNLLSSSGGQYDGLVNSNAARAPHEDYLEVLLRHNAARLYNAAIARDVALVGEILADGTEPNHADEKGRLPLHAAALSGSERVVRRLIEAAADANRSEQGGALPLQIAAFHGYTEVTKLLLGASASINATDNNDKTALFSAASQGHASMVKLLLNHNADLRKAARAEDQGFPPMTPLQVAQHGRHTQAVKILLDAEKLMPVSIMEKSQKGFDDFINLLGRHCMSCCSLGSSAR